MKAKTLKVFFPEASPRKEFQLDVGKITNREESHILYVAEYGNAKGIPVVIFHGGPGAGAPPIYAQYFNPKEYRIILYDQRGAGNSTPAGCMIDNNTEFLLEDIEKLRAHLGIEKWVLFGGSWGATLAILYAEKHPENVLGIILRGPFLGREHDTTAFLREDCPAALMRPAEWKKFNSELEKLWKASGLNKKTQDILDKLYFLLIETSSDIQTKVSALLSWWELANSSIEVDLNQVEAECQSPDGINMGRTEITFLRNRCFLKPNQILNNIEQLKNIPIFVVQGNWDLICPQYQAEDLVTALNPLTEVTFYRTTAGHTISDPENVHYLIESTEQLAKRLKDENK